MQPIILMKHKIFVITLLEEVTEEKNEEEKRENRGNISSALTI
jgi:hypothetical protein